MASVLVIGAQGVLGRLTAETFQSYGWDVLRGGRRPEQSVGFRFVDLDRPETLEAASSEVDVIVSAVEDPLCRAQRHVLEHGGLILTMATIAAVDRDRVASAFPNPKGTSLFNVGYSGFTSIAVKELLAQHPEADSVLGAFTISLKGTSGRGGAMFGHRLLSGGGRRRTVEIDFGSPIGRRRCLVVDATTDRFIDPSVLGSRVTTSCLAVAEPAVGRALLLLDTLNVLRWIPPSVVRPRPPKEPALEHVSTEAMMTWLGVSRGSDVLAKMILLATGDYLTSARIAERVASLIREEPRQVGSFTLDTWFTWDQVTPELSAMGITQVSGDITRSTRE